jgi:trehalose utilization protein
VHLDEPEYGLGGHALDQCDVLIWWGHVRNREVPFELGKKIVEQVKAGKLALLCLHSAHWSAPFIEAMNARTIDDATKTVPSAIREQTKVTLIPPKVYRVPKKDARPTPSWELKNAADGTHELVITLPSCVFPAYRADGQPSHVTTLLPDHPIAAHIPAHFDLPATEMYDAPFWVPAPDVVIFEERWDKGEHFPSGCLWNLGKGLVFYFRPGHEIYPVYKQKEPLQIIENATRWMAWEIRYTSDIAEPKR